MGLFSLSVGCAVAQDTTAPAPALPDRVERTTTGSQGRPLDAKLREGLYLEEATQDLDGARQAYSEILALFDQDRATAAAALFRLGEVSRKLNQPEAAKDAFRRIVRDFSDREPLVRLARENLKALGGTLPEGGTGQMAPAADPEQEKALARLQELHKSSPDLVLSPQTSLESNGYLSYDEALKAGYLRVVTWFLEHGASPDLTPSKSTPLSLVAEKGHTPLVEFLLSRKAAIEGQRKDSPLPLCMAAAKGHRTVAALLIGHGADVNGGGEKPTPLSAAVRGKHKAVASLLLERGADPNLHEGEALKEAVGAEDAAMVKLLLDHQANPNPPGPQSILWLAVMVRFDKTEDTSTLTALVEAGADVNLHNGEALMEAVINDDVPMVKALLANKADPNKATRQLLHRRTQIANQSAGNFDNEWDGLPKDVRNDFPKQPYAGFGTWDEASVKDTVSALHLACLRKQEAIIAALIAAGAEVNARTALGSTPLEAACVRGSLGAAQLLMKAGANAEAVAPGGLRLIDLAIMKFDWQLYDLLRQAGAPLRGESPSGAPPWELLDTSMTWKRKGKEESVEEPFDKLFERLLEDGADPDGNESFRPVNVIATHGKAHLIPFLKRKGANFRPAGLMSPVAAALPRFVETGDISIIHALLEAGADINGNSPRVKPHGNMAPGAVMTESALTSLVRPLPKSGLIDAFLLLKPTADEALQALLWDRETIRQKIEIMGKDSSTSRTLDDPVTGGYTHVEEQKKRQEQRLALAQQLWAHQRDRMNPRQWSRPWVEAVNKEGKPSLTTLCPAGRSSAPVTVLEAMVYALGNARTEDKPGDAITTQWNEDCADYSKLVIHRLDPKSHNILREEPVDLLAWAEKGDPTQLPVIGPGDVLAFISGEQKDGNPPNAMPEVLRKRLPDVYRREITLSAGVMKLALKLTPPLPEKTYRQDPASRELPVEPTLGTVLTYLPKPDFFYRMERVTLRRKDGTTQTVDARQPLTAAQDMPLVDGDEIALEEVPLDDAGLRSRVAQGIFIGRETNGFLEEVIHASSPPDPGGWSDDTKQDLLRHFYSKSKFVLPWMDAARLKTGPVLAGTMETNAPWGQVLDVPCGLERVDHNPNKAWGPSDPAHPERPLIEPDKVALKLRFEVRGKGIAGHLFYYRNPVFHESGGNWNGYVTTGGSITLTTRTLPHVLDAMDASRYYGRPKQAAQSRWEVKREGQEPPLAAFTPGKDAIPFLMLKDGDTISLDEIDAPLLQAPDVRQKNGVSWQPAQLVTSATQASPQSGSPMPTSPAAVSKPKVLRPASGDQPQPAKP